VQCPEGYDCDGANRTQADGGQAIRHQPVLLSETLEFLKIRPDGNYIDATLGNGGHAEEVLKGLETGHLLAIDRDPEACARSVQRLVRFSERLIVMQGNFAEIDALHARSGLPPVEGMLADLGLSSVQLNDAARGFSFNLSGPLDMRMDPSASVTADTLVNRLREEELADLIYKFGEERHSRRIARAIMKARPIRTTTELAQVVTRAIPSRAGLHHIHPATRTFMALRIAVNEELANLESFLAKAVGVLATRGRLVILSFHSLEDRLVKRAFQGWKRDRRALILTPKVVRAGAAELRCNPRARSAKLRAAEKLADQESPVRMERH
jgi:16S rRNA (cytosine1402-N4)-methyltransferase